MNTYGETIVMGRKTWDSMGHEPLPNRQNIVVSRKAGCMSMSTVQEYLATHTDAWVIGGACLCESLWKPGDILVLTRVNMKVSGGVGITLPPMREVWSKDFCLYKFSINILE